MAALTDHKVAHGRADRADRAATAVQGDEAARCYALVPCAGVGLRAGAAGPKQYASLAGRAVVAHTLAALADVPRLAATLVVLAPLDDAFEAHAPGFHGPRSWLLRSGG